MDDNNDDHDSNNGDPRRTEAAPTPFPPRMSCITAMGIISFLFFMSSILTLFALTFFIFGLLFLWTIKLIEWFRGDNLGLEMEYIDMEDFDAMNGDVEDDEKAVKFLEGLFKVVKGKESGRKESKKKEESKTTVGAIECFGSDEEMAELGYRECTICLEDFQKGEKCLVFPGCGHIFHGKCIVRWLKNKPTCPLCRYSVASKVRGARGCRRSSFQPSWGV